MTIRIVFLLIFKELIEAVDGVVPDALHGAGAIEDNEGLIFVCHGDKFINFGQR